MRVHACVRTFVNACVCDTSFLDNSEVMHMIGLHV